MEFSSPLWPAAAVFAPLIFGLITLRLPRRMIDLRTLVAALGPVGSIVALSIHLGSAGVSPHATEVWPWVPLLHLNFTFLVDGLGTFFAFLVAGIGLMIVLYARAYFGRDEDEQFRFYPTLGFFTTAMMGIVLSDSMLLMLTFWEMTSISSFFLIGWYRYDKDSVKKAMQAFFTTGLGGLSIFGGILIFGGQTGIWRWSEFLAWQPQFNPMIVAAFVLMYVGAATKSAQWPWHYWLPGAMVAPTPVSTFLHAATMVKAGIFLTARTFPIFGNLELWPWLILIPGSVTMLMGAVIALNQHDLKRIFAYTTVSQLGLLMSVYALGAFRFTGHAAGASNSHGTDTGAAGGHLNDATHGAAEVIAGAAGRMAGGVHHAVETMLPAIDIDITQIANHAFYKAPLFIIAGAIAHVAGTRDLPKLWKFRRQNLPMVIVMVLAGYALAGGPGTVSFPAKEAFFYAIYHLLETHWFFAVLAVMAVLSAMCNVAIFVRLTTTLLGLPGGLRDRSLDAHDHQGPAAHESGHGHGGHDGHETGLWPLMLWIPALLIVSMQYLGGLVPPAWNAIFMPLETNVNYSAFAAGVPWLWQLHFNLPLMMSLAAIMLGIALGYAPIMRGAIGDVHDRVYPGMYYAAVHGGGAAFRMVQTGNFRHYLLLLLLALIIGMGGFIWLDRDRLYLPDVNPFEFIPGVLLGVVICMSAVFMPIMQRRVVRVLLLGACGFSVVGMYLLYEAPDLALTQVMFELVSVILFVLALRMLPKPDRKRRPSRLMRLAIAGAVGISLGYLTLIAAEAPTRPDRAAWEARLAAAGEFTPDPRVDESDLRPLGWFFARHSIEGTPLTENRGGGGANIVNVVLVDFRGFDTLGEITVLSIAALGVWSLLPGRRAKSLQGQGRQDTTETKEAATS